MSTELVEAIDSAQRRDAGTTRSAHLPSSYLARLSLGLSCEDSSGPRSGSWRARTATILWTRKILFF